jgi:hypothetical protein
MLHFGLSSIFSVFQNVVYCLRYITHTQACSFMDDNPQCYKTGSLNKTPAQRAPCQTELDDLDVIIFQIFINNFNILTSPSQCIFLLIV